jgi:hypothetical protein
MSEYAESLSGFTAGERPADQLALTDDGLELPDQLVGTAGFVKVATPTAIRTVVVSAPGLSPFAHLLWRYPQSPETLQPACVADGEILLGTRLSDLRRYAVVDQRSDAGTADITLHAASGHLDHRSEYRHLLQLIRLQLQAVDATLDLHDSVPTESRQTIRAACDQIDRCLDQVQLLYPTPRPAVRDDSFVWNARLSLASADDHLRALKETLWGLSEHVEAQADLSVSATRTVTTLLTTSQEHCIDARRHWHTLSTAESRIDPLLSQQGDQNG